ncbi:uncharacterized protein [Euwallacea similis]|uniref:uncharacterized protein n=1 Tax=Euwallacea similis TaxID=1736056 RepID=UPI00344C5260
MSRKNSVFGHICNECQTCLVTENDQKVQLEDTSSSYPAKKKKRKVKILSTLDILISVLIVTPLVVACWRGTWQLMDIYEDYFPPWESFIIGTLFHIVIGTAQESFNDLINKEHKYCVSQILAYLFMKLYTLVLNVVTNLHWRGIWILLDQYFGVSVTATGETKVVDYRGAICFYGICFLAMFSMRCLRNLNSPPFEICLDYGDSMFLFPSMFKMKVSEKLSLYVLDVVFSTAVVTNLGIAVWRGLWLLIDIYFFPNYPIVSSWASLFVGYVMVAIVFTSQSMMKKLCDFLDGIPRLLIADSYMMFSVMAVIFLWRGIWSLINIYFLPEHEEMSCWISNGVSMLILMIMGCSNSVLVRGVCLDCEEPDGTCVVFPCNYLKDIFDQEKYYTWFSIWSGINKKKNLPIFDKTHFINVINYHVVDLQDLEDNVKINDDVNKEGIP